MTVAVVVTCLALVLAGLVAVVRWSGLAFERPPGPRPEPGRPRPVGLVLRRYLWYLDIAVVAGLGAGVVAAGAGGRLAMRLLAVTAGPAAQGRVTEADQVVGVITIGGTIGFVLFISLFLGPLSGALYLLVRRWLPAGPLSGLAYGALLLVGAGARIDPLRADNPDFDIVGPGWVSVAVFAAVVLLHGLLVAALAARLSRALPLPGRLPGTLAYLPLLVLVPLPPFAVAAALGALVAVAASRVGPLAAAWRDRRVDLGGRVALLLIGLVAAPGFVSSVADILGRP